MCVCLSVCVCVCVCVCVFMCGLLRVRLVVLLVTLVYLITRVRSLFPAHNIKLFFSALSCTLAAPHSLPFLPFIFAHEFPGVYAYKFRVCLRSLLLVIVRW